MDWVVSCKWTSGCAGDAKEAPFSLWDCAGWTDHEYQSGEPGFILDGNLPDRFDLSQAISPQSRDFVTAPDLADRVHCVCFIVPCEAASDQEYMKRLKQMKKFAMDRGAKCTLLSRILLQ